jgi:anti-anti-sigma regulatory factor
MTLRIERDFDGHHTTIRLIGYVTAQHLEDLQQMIAEGGPKVALNLEEVSLVDVEVVRFLGTCHAGGVRFTCCPQYIKEWMARERKTK